MIILILPFNPAQIVGLDKLLQFLKRNGQHIFTQFLANKKIEWNRFRTHVSNYEIDNYLPKL